MIEMRAALLTGIGQFALQELPVPHMQRDDEVLVRICMVGVCGSDIHYFTSGRIGDSAVRFPFCIGHEAAGIVESTGREVTRVRPGQRIAIDPARSCGSCDQCLNQRENTCRRLRFLGAPGQLSGCLCDYVVLHEAQCFPVPESMTFAEAVLAEPLAVALYAVERARMRSGACAAILGAGPIGQSVLQVLHAQGAGPLFVTDLIEARLDFARRTQPCWAGHPGRDDIEAEISRLAPLQMDVVFECSGTPEALAQGIRLLKPGGKLVMIGIPDRNEIVLPIHELRRKEIDLLNIRRQFGCTEKAIALLAQGRVSVGAMATHHFRLEETAAAFRLVATRGDGVLKAMITLQ